MTGTIVKIYGRFYTVECDGRRLNSTLRGKLRRDKLLDTYSEAAAVGDTVEIELSDDGTGTIERIYKRRNIFTRKHKDSDREDPIAANLDQIVVIQSFVRPRLNQRFVDRLLTRGSKEGIPALVCLNKLDLAGEDDINAVRSYYRGYDPDIIMVSAKTGHGLDDLKGRLAGRLSLLIGNSGVGKTSILNGLYPGLDLSTNEVSARSGKGRHTTTNVEMFRMKNDTKIVDTPGLREFGLVDIGPDELGLYFMEFKSYAARCGFSPCSHDHEPGCEVKRRVEKGKIAEERYVSYLNILYSLKDYHKNRYR